MRSLHGEALLSSKCSKTCLVHGGQAFSRLRMAMVSLAAGACLAIKQMLLSSAPVYELATFGVLAKQHAVRMPCGSHACLNTWIRCRFGYS